MRILLAEDGADVAEAIIARAAKMGHAVDWESNGASAARRAIAAHYDLLILDVMLPEMDGLAILRKVRAARRSTQVLMLTACGEIEERVHALDMGANDYLVKPFDFRELEARIRALLRQGSAAPTNMVAFGKVAMDTKSRTVTLAGLPLELTRRETNLLEVLMTRPGRIFCKEELMDRLFGIDDTPNANAIEQYVARLRRKLTGAGFEIRTLRGLGYQIVPA